MVGEWVTTDFECDYEYFFFIRCCYPRLSPRDMLRFLFVAHAFLLMFCATRPTGSDRHKT